MSRTESERLSLKKDLKALKTGNKNLSHELKSIEEVVIVLSLDYNKLKIKHIKHNKADKRSAATAVIDESFKIPKQSNKQPINSVWSPAPETNNTFSSLAYDKSLSLTSTSIEVTALVHSVDTTFPSSERIPEFLNFDRQIREENQENILVLSDSHGKNLYHCMKTKLENLTVTVLSKSGPKFKHVVKEGYPLAKKMSNSDWVIILAGTNDVDPCVLGQLTIN